MKANAPEKIYICDLGSELSYDWSNEHCCESDIEYTRTDAFIEKAAEWLDKNFLRYNTDSSLERDDFVKGFKKAMKRD